MVLMKLSQESKLLLLLARFPYEKKTDEEIKAILEKSTVDWNLFFKIGIEQKISMIVFHRIQKFIDFVPNEEFAGFRAKCLQQLRNNLLNTKELLRIYEAAEEHGLNIISYKGAVFADEVYGGINLRVSGDIDFWYAFEDTPTVKKIMRDEGYELVINYNKIQNFFFTKINCEYHFYKRFEKNGQRVLIEPHHHLINHFLKKKPTKEDLAKYIKQKDILNKKIKTFSPELTIIYLVLHHGVNENWSFFKHYIDLAAYINRYFDKLDWAEILDICEKYEIKKTFLVGVNLTQSLLKIDLPDVLEEEANQKEIGKISQLCLKNSWSSFNNNKKRPLLKIYLLWKTRENFTQKIKLIWRVIEYSFLRLLFFLSMKLT
jgi:hypothetical protein